MTARGLDLDGDSGRPPLLGRPDCAPRRGHQDELLVDYSRPPGGYGALRTARTGPRLNFKPRPAPLPSAAALPLKKTRQADPSDDGLSLDVQ
jgi:hypothetical protein